MTETLTRPDGNWWSNLIESTNIEDPLLKKKLLELDVVKKGEKLYITGYSGEKIEAYLTTIMNLEGQAVIAWEKGINEEGGKVLEYVAIPGLPWEEITRNGKRSKVGWRDEDNQI